MNRDGNGAQMEYFDGFLGQQARQRCCGGGKINTAVQYSTEGSISSRKSILDVKEDVVLMLVPGGSVAHKWYCM